jgi:DNA-binding HxlR family transcriptional regulator
MKHAAFSAAGALRDPVDRSLFSRAVRMIAGRWKLDILALLQSRPHRFSELRRAIPGVTAQMLTVQLRELEADGLIDRRILDAQSQRIEYAATRRTQQIDPMVEAGVRWLRETGGEDANNPDLEADTDRKPSQALGGSTT